MKDTKRKREKPEDFVGWKSEDGLLEVVELLEKSNHPKFKVICHNCKEDKELFPKGYFISTKSNIIKEKKPCGCSKCPKWNQAQFLVLASRASEGRFTILGLAEEFHGQNTKLNLECLIDGHKWTASINNIINHGRGCPKCARNMLGNTQRINEQKALDRCTEICKTKNYKPIGFISGYKNVHSRFNYVCQTHGKQSVSYNNFVKHGSRCKGCWLEKQKDLGNGNGYYPERKDEQDFLYVLNFNDKFIKIGRSFDVERRIGKNELQKESGISNIIKLRIFTATHKEIYDIEQEILEELRGRGFQYHVDWSTECFENECKFTLYKLLNMCDTITEV